MYIFYYFLYFLSLIIFNIFTNLRTFYIFTAFWYFLRVCEHSSRRVLPITAATMRRNRTEIEYQSALRNPLALDVVMSRSVQIRWLVDKNISKLSNGGTRGNEFVMPDGSSFDRLTAARWFHWLYRGLIDDWVTNDTVNKCNSRYIYFLSRSIASSFDVRAIRTMR